MLPRLRRTKSSAVGANRLPPAAGGAAACRGIFFTGMRERCSHLVFRRRHESCWQGDGMKDHCHQRSQSVMDDGRDVLSLL